MIVGKYEEISNHQFTMAMHKLTSATPGNKTAYRIKKLADEVNKLKKQMHEEYKKEIAPQFCKLDEAGEVIIPMTPREGVEKQVQEADEAFGKREFKILRPKLTGAELNSIKLSADDLGALEPFIDIESLEKSGPSIPGMPLSVAG